MIKDKLQIYIITYNRKKTFEYTLKKVLENEDFGACNICILDNASTDGTSELIDEYCKKYTNLTHIRHQINVGGNANICRAFEMAASCGKDYFWVLCDDDEYTFTGVKELEDMMDKKVDAICVERKAILSPKNMYQTLILAASFVPAIIYKTENVTSQVLQNMYWNIYNSYPHMALIIYIANNKLNFTYATQLVYQKINSSFHRGINSEEHFKSKNLVLQVGLINSYQMINDKKLRAKCCDSVWTGKSFFKAMLEVCKYHEMKTYNITDSFWGLNIWQRIQFIIAYIIANIQPVNYRYLNVQLEEDWLEYLKKVNEQSYINKLAKKLKNKKIVLYGAGLLTNIIMSNYDISKLNIIGVADKRFEDTDETYWKQYPIVKIKDMDKKADAILISLKTYNAFRYKFMVKYKINKKIFSILNTSIFYPVVTLQKQNMSYIKLYRRIYLTLCKHCNSRKFIRRKCRKTLNTKNQIFSFKDIK